MDTLQHPESVPTKEQIERAIREAAEKLSLQRQFDHLAEHFAFLARTHCCHKAKYPYWPVEVCFECGAVFGDDENYRLFMEEMKKRGQSRRFHRGGK